MEEQGIRLNKYIADAGYCSRREADKLIETGKVTVDGKPASLGMRIFSAQKVCVWGQLLRKQEEKVYLAFHKPQGIVCTSEKMEKNNIIDYIGYPIRISYCGRLDKNSEGLIILTNDGDIVNRMMRSGNMHEKEYIVSVDKEITEEFIKEMQKGVYLEELQQTTRKCKAEKVSNTSFRIILTQGLNRQIRRMCDVYGYQVMKLVRVRIMNIELGNLKSGTYRALTAEELTKLKKSIKNSDNNPNYEDRIE